MPVNAAPAIATPESTQNSLQTLNSALAALGLNAAEIQAFDQFASVILQFDPNGQTVQLVSPQPATGTQSTAQPAAAIGQAARA
jgi:hypothetical protein